MKRAFGEDDQTFNDTLDSDFNEDSFQNLLDSDDNFQPMIRNSQNGKSFVIVFITVFIVFVCDCNLDLIVLIRFSD